MLNGLFMQILATRLTGSRLAGIVAGFGFAFVPFVVINAATHAQFAHAWPLLLIIWRTLEVAERPTRRNAILAAWRRSSRSGSPRTTSSSAGRCC